MLENRSIQHASQRLLRDTLALTVTDIRRADLPDLRNWLVTVERRLKRERNKGAMQHWSYDLNRHLALKSIRDSIRDQIHACCKK